MRESEEIAFQAAVNSPCDETVGRARGPARGMGEMRGDPGALPAVWGYWEYGVPCGYMSGDLLLTSQVPQGNLETMMRILINSAGALCAYTSGGDRLLRMATLLFGSRSRAEWSLPPTAIVTS